MRESNPVRDPEPDRSTGDPALRLRRLWRSHPARRLLRLFQMIVRSRRPVIFNDLERWSPVGERFGRDRGIPIDRYYIREFIASRRDRIRGDAVEVGDPYYLNQFGDLTRSRTVLSIQKDNPYVDVCVDLQHTDQVPEGIADCFVCTQTLMFVYDFRAAIRSAHRLLRPGGTLLLTAAGLAPLSQYDDERWGDYFRFMPRAMERVMESVFGRGNFSMHIHGNALAACCLIQGVALEDLPNASVLDPVDARYPVIIGVEATRSD